MTKKKTKKDLIPVDLTRCQTMRRDGTFMSFGPVPWVRCSNAAAYVVTERRLAEGWSVRGSMSVCESCKSVLLQQHGPEYVTLKKIKVPRKAA